MKNKFTLVLFVFYSFCTFGQTVLDVQKTEKLNENGIELTTYMGKPYTGIVTETYQNGKTKSWINVKDGLANGLWQEWYSNGHLKFNSNWRNGKGHGLWEYYYENGILRQEEYYNMDIPIGIFRDYHNNGILKIKSMWLNGKKHGVWSFYDATGTLIKTENYDDNEKMSTTEN